MFTPYILYLKIAAALALVAGILFAGHEVANHWRDQGRVEVQARWDKADRARHAAEQIAYDNRVTENAKQALINEAKNKELSDEYDRRIELQNRNNAADIAAIKSHGGLRMHMPTAFCSGFASKASAPGAERNYEAGTSRLPEQIENGLFQYASERDQEIIQLGSCQKWIRDNGFYKDEK